MAHGMLTAKVINDKPLRLTEAMVRLCRELALVHDMEEIGLTMEGVTVTCKFSKEQLVAMRKKLANAHARRAFLAKKALAKQLIEKDEDKNLVLERDKAKALAADEETREMSLQELEEDILCYPEEYADVFKYGDTLEDVLKNYASIDKETENGNE